MPAKGSLQYSDDSWEIRTMQMTTDSSQLIYPVDAMHLLHKALRTEAAHVEEAVNVLEIGGSFKSFQRAFYRWAMALGYHVEVIRALEIGDNFQPLAQVFQRWASTLEYHAVMEDRYMTAPLDRLSVRTNEAEHQHLNAWCELLQYRH